MEDRRKYFRFETPINVKYASKRNKRKVKTLTKNISRGGLSLSSTKKFRTGDIIKMEFNIPDSKSPAVANGTIVWVKGSAKRPRSLFDSGVKFTNIKPADRGRILEHAYNKWLDLNNYKVTR